MNTSLPVLRRCGAIFSAAQIFGVSWWVLTVTDGMMKRASRAAAVAACVVLLAACGSQAESAFHRANSVCGSAKPVHITQHVHTYPDDNWLEVKCSDGSTRAVKGG